MGIAVSGIKVGDILVYPTYALVGRTFIGKRVKVIRKDPGGRLLVQLLDYGTKYDPGHIYTTSNKRWEWGSPSDIPRGLSPVMLRIHLIHHRQQQKGILK